MKTIEELKAEQAAALAKLEKEHALAAADIVRRSHFNAGNLEAYLGDDGEAYICGKES